MVGPRLRSPISHERAQQVGGLHLFCSWRTLAYKCREAFRERRGGGIARQVSALGRRIQSPSGAAVAEGQRDELISAARFHSVCGQACITADFDLRRAVAFTNLDTLHLQLPYQH